MVPWTNVNDFPPLRHHPSRAPTHSARPLTRSKPSISGNPGAHRSGGPIGGRRGGFCRRWFNGSHNGEDLSEKFDESIQLANKTSNNVVKKNDDKTGKKEDDVNGGFKVKYVDACGDIPVDVTKPVHKFEEISELGLALHENIKRCNYVNPTPDLILRHAAIPILMACGETAAFCFPIIARILTRRPPTVAVPCRVGGFRGPSRPASNSPLALIMPPTRGGLSSQIHDKAKRCNYANPTPIQGHVIPTLMAGRDLIMARAQTGSGKTTAFRFPVNARIPNIRPVIAGGGFRGYSRPACPLSLIMSPTRELSSQVAKSKLPFFGSRVQYRSLYNSCSTAYWKSNVSFDDQGFYDDHIRSCMMSCYARMKFTPEIPPKVIRFISVVDFVSLVLRYPSGFEESFWNEVVQNWIVVEDTNQSTYPPWFLPLGLSVLNLKQQVEILCPPLPAPGVDIFYCDGCPSTIKNLPGGGGVLRVEYMGKDTANVKVSAFGVVVQYCDSFETEVRVLLAAATYAKRMGLQRCVFYSDNLDLIEGLNGRRLLRDSYRKLISQIIDATSHLKERWFVYTPREGVAASDEIAWQVRVGERRNSAHKKCYWPGQMKELDVVEEGLVKEHYGKLIWNVLPTGNLILKINKACFRTPLIRFEFLNNSEASLPREEIEKKKRYCPEKEYGYQTGSGSPSPSPSPGVSPR